MSSVYRQLSRYCRILLLTVVSCTVIWTATDRFAPPTADRYVYGLPPGGADMYVPWAAARALLAGHNPYLTPLHDPWSRFEMVNGQPFYLLYPPAIVTLYLPLAYFVGDFVAAGGVMRVWHFIVLAALAGLSILLIRGIRRSRAGQEAEPLLALVLFFCIALSPQTSLALERAQSDLTIALLCWAAAVLILRGYTFVAVFLATAATLAKGYPLVFGLGVGLLGLTKQSVWRALTGAASAALLLLVPMRSYLETGFEAARFRSNMVCYEWRNYAFSQFMHQHFPDSTFASHWGRVFLAGLCCLMATLCLVQALRVEPRSAARWFVPFSLFALIATCGYSSCGYMYSFVLIAPGLLVFLACAPELFGVFGFGPRSALVFAALQAIPAHALFIVRYRDPTHSAAADGLVLFVLFNAAACGFYLLRASIAAHVHKAKA